MARVLVAEEDRDPALAAAWADRMAMRRSVFRRVVDRLADDRALATGWSTDDAEGVLYAATAYGPWRELTDRFGWTGDRYVETLTRQLRSSLLAPPGRPGG